MGGTTMFVPKLQTVQRLLAVFAVTGLLLLSGCAGKTKAAVNANAPPEASFSDTTGAIQGTVLSMDELPVAGANVGLLGVDVPDAKTDESGIFVFGDLEPGTYSIVVAALMFESASETVDVVAGEVKDVEIRLIDTAAEGIPYTRVLGPFNGKFFCGFATAAVTGPCKFFSFPASSPLAPVEGAYQGVAGDENNIWILPRAIEGNKSHPNDVSGGAVVEITWTPTSGASRWLSGSIEMVEETDDGTGTRNGTDSIYWDEEMGEGPLKLMAEPGKVSDNARGGEMMPLDVRGFTVGVFPIGDPNGPVVEPLFPLTPAAYTEQPFQVWITLFYNQAPAADYTVLVA